MAPCALLRMRSQAAPLLTNFSDDRTGKFCLIEKNVIFGGFVDFRIANIILSIAIAIKNEELRFVWMKFEVFLRNPVPELVASFALFFAWRTFKMACVYGADCNSHHGADCNTVSIDPRRRHIIRCRPPTYLLVRKG